MTVNVSRHAIFSNLNVTTKKQKRAEVSLWFHMLWVLTLRSYLKNQKTSSFNGPHPSQVQANTYHFKAFYLFITDMVCSSNQ